MSYRSQRMFEQSTSYSSTNNYSNIPIQNCGFANTSMGRSYEKLLVYRTYKPNINLKINNLKQQKKSNIPSIICSFLGIDYQNQTEQRMKQCRCRCPRTEDNLCSTVMKWIQQEYFWKTDPQFFKILNHYNRKKLEPEQETLIVLKLQKILGILGLQIPKQWFKQIIQLLSNYWKHAQYYGKFDKLIANSDIYIWVCLGILFHIGFGSQQLTNQTKSLIFWALDISMDKFQDLSLIVFKREHIQTVKMFQSYYSKWCQVLTSRGVNLTQLSWQFLNQMMFGYMGIQTIVFFLDCFRKIGWQYIHKVILSYFQQKLTKLKQNQKFLNDCITTQQLLEIIMDGKQQWPMIFCLASTFKMVQ